jgi:soluble lytic murein transglycosylase
VEIARRGKPETAARALLLKAKRALKSDDNQKTRTLMEQVIDAGPNTKQAEEAAYYVGWLPLRDDKFRDAADSFENFLQRWPSSRRRDEVQWFRTLALLRLGQYSDAKLAAQALVNGSPKSQLVPQGLYWVARASQLDGAAEAEVVAAFQRVVDQYPATFYALLARERLAQMGRPPVGWLPTIAPPASPAPPLPKSLEIAAALQGCGLFLDAEAEAQSALRTVRSQSAALEAATGLQQLGYFGHAHQLANRWLWGAAFTERRPEALTLFYPRAFEPSVVAEAKARGADPYLVWAVMRRESGFKPAEISSANARGLLQIIQPTAVNIAKELSIRPPEAEELYLPELNIQFGAWYLAALQKRFRHPVLVAAAYNAGPAAVLRWTKERGDLPMDLFVETMAFRETRGYVRQVVADLASYHALYDGGGAPIALQLPEPLATGVSF